ncbi:MAG: P-loop NTPase family protein [Ignavibacteriaceae bacterium]
MGYSTFIPSQEVVNSKELFGRNKPDRELDSLLKSLLYKKCNPQVIGERRSGKSSLIKCAKSNLLKLEDAYNILSVIINFKNYYMIKGVSKGYKLLAAHFLFEMDMKNKFKTKQISLGPKLIINYCDSIESYFHFLDSKSFRGEKIFEKLIEFIASNNFSTILFIDEFESMFFSTFESSLGSVHPIRDLIMSSLPNNSKFNCCITGTRTWDNYAQDVGSDDFNVTQKSTFFEGGDVLLAKPENH